MNSFIQNQGMQFIHTALVGPAKTAIAVLGSVSVYIMGPAITGLGLSTPLLALFNR